MLASNKLLRPGELSDLYDDGREKLGLSILHQAASEYFRDLRKRKTLDCAPTVRPVKSNHVYREGRGVIISVLV